MTPVDQLVEEIYHALQRVRCRNHVPMIAVALTAEEWAIIRHDPRGPPSDPDVCKIFGHPVVVLGRIGPEGD